MTLLAAMGYALLTMLCFAALIAVLACLAKFDDWLYEEFGGKVQERVRFTLFLLGIFAFFTMLFYIPT